MGVNGVLYGLGSARLPRERRFEPQVPPINSGVDSQAAEANIHLPTCMEDGAVPHAHGTRDILSILHFPIEIV